MGVCILVDRRGEELDTQHISKLVNPFLGLGLLQKSFTSVTFVAYPDLTPPPTFLPISAHSDPKKSYLPAFHTTPAPVPPKGRGQRVHTTPTSVTIETVKKRLF